MIVFEPKVADCKPGLYCVLTNGWIVGPIVSTEYDGSGVYVRYHKEGLYQVDVSDQYSDDPEYIFQPRYVLAVGTKKELFAHYAN